MNLPLHTLTFRGLALALAMSLLSSQARANVYATNLRLNGSTASPTVVAGQDVSIGYTLNERASAGVTIRILSGTNVIGTLAGGTNRGNNTVTWNANVAGGDFSFSVTAAASGYGVWTQISADTNAGNQVARALGIAVNQNTNSPYYGRVFVANANLAPGDPLGFHKLNADGTAAEEGMLSTGGYNWILNNYLSTPFRLRVATDDRLYALDYSGHGNILSWDQQITTNSLLRVMRDDNNLGFNAYFSGFSVTGAGTNQQVWMADDNGSGYGIIGWTMQTNGTLATNDTGVTAVAPGGELAGSAYDVALDKNGKIYALCQPADPSKYKIMRFPAYSNTPLSTAEWKVDNTSGVYDAYALAVNPAATYVAVARAESGWVDILNANTGAKVTTISSNRYPHYAVAWDNVGNVYPCYDIPDPNFSADTNSFWQAWSPPGANQATTYGLQTIHVLQAPNITNIVVSGPNLIITFTGPANYPSAVFTVLSGSVASSVTNILAATITGSGGVFRAVVPFDGTQRFYRIQMPTTSSWIYIMHMRSSGSTVTLDFTGSASDLASAFKVLSGSVANGITNLTAATITGSAGVFQATVAANGSQQFYRVRK